MPDSADLQLLDRYFAGECTSEERAQVQAWAAAAPDARRELERWRVIFVASGRLPASVRHGAVTDAAWASVVARLQTGGAAFGHGAEGRRAGRPRGVHLWSGTRQRTATWRSAAIAASLMVALGLGLAIGRGRSQSPAHAETRDYATTAGQRLSVSMSDGSQFTLGPASRLQVPVTYGRETRTVTLDGEAFFSVVHDSARPFVVRAGNAVATDIGTRFDVRAYPGDSAVQIAVQGGKVAMTIAGRPVPGRPIVAGPRDLATIGASGTIDVAHNADLADYTAWATGTLVFHDTPLRAVLPGFSRWYDLDVTTGDSVLATRLVTASWSAQSPDQALSELAGLLNAHVTRRGRLVSLSSLPSHY